MGELEQELLELSRTYFQEMDEDLSDEFILALIKSAIDEYKLRRSYPSSYTDEMIETDVSRYFNLRKNYVAMRALPEMYGRIGGEGLSMLTDAGTSRFYAKYSIFDDVVPICEVI